MKFDELYENTINEAKGSVKPGKDVVIVSSPEDLGPNFPFKTGDTVKVGKFLGYQGDEEEYEVSANGKKAILTDVMFESVIAEAITGKSVVNTIDKAITKISDAYTELANAYEDSWEQDEEMAELIWSSDDWLNINNAIDQATKSGDFNEMAYIVANARDNIKALKKKVK